MTCGDDVHPSPRQGAVLIPEHLGTDSRDLGIARTKPSSGWSGLLASKAVRQALGARCTPLVSGGSATRCSLPRWNGLRSTSLGRASLQARSENPRAVTRDQKSGRSS